LDDFDFFEDEPPLRNRLWAACLNLLSFGIVIGTIATCAFAFYILFNPYSPYNPFPPEISVLLPSAPSPTVEPVGFEIENATNTPESTSTETAIPLPTSTPIVTGTATPVPTATSNLTFAVIGDYGRAGAPLAAVATMIASWEVDFIITTGDNNYPNGEASTIDRNIGQYFHQYIYPYQGDYGPGAEVNRFFPTMGNHDWNAENGQAYIDYFELPGNERYYEVEFDFIHLFAVSSHLDEPDGTRENSIQAQWLQEALSASTAPWKVVYFHHTPYSSGHWRGSFRLQWPFKDWGASVVIAGHDHIYERLEIDGLTYFVNGVGGGGLYPITAPEPGSQVRYSSNHGAMLVNATPTRITFQFINIDGDIIDTYVIEK
jgi:hypothetical protein